MMNPCLIMCIAISFSLYSAAIIFVFFHSCSSPPPPRQATTPSLLHIFSANSDPRLLPPPPPAAKKQQQSLFSKKHEAEDDRPIPIPVCSNEVKKSTTSAPSAPLLLKVFMYDLPKKFTYGVIKEYRRARSLVPQDHPYPGNQHSAEWYLFIDLLQKSSSPNQTNSAAVRVVVKPQDADVFYVPFFSSLSLTVNSTRFSDERMQMELLEWLEGQETWHRNRGRDHVFVCQDPNALHYVIDRIKNSILLVSDFGRLEPEQGSWWKDVVLPYSHRIPSYVKENVTLERNTLLFFMGNRYRKEGGRVRDELFKLLANETDMVIKQGIQSLAGRRMAAQGMRTSKFCLHPAGDTPSACRLFDAIASICVPVVVSDDIELPFEDELDYTRFSIFVPLRKALKPDYLASMLRRINDKELQRYQQQLRKVRKYFEYDAENGAVDRIWRAVAQKLPRVRTMIHRERRAMLDS